jgi:hypothetical protein
VTFQERRREIGTDEADALQPLSRKRRAIIRLRRRQAGVKVADDLVDVVLDELGADDFGVFAEAQDPVRDLG